MSFKLDGITMNCKNCNAEFKGNYCNNCGQKFIDERYTVNKTLSTFFETILNFEKGFLKTAILLITNPGKLIRNYLNGVTIIYYNPIKYLIFITSVSLLISFQLDLYDEQQKQIIESFETDREVKQRQLEIIQKTKEYANLFLLLILPFISAISLLLFKKTKFNYAEHIVFNAFTFGQSGLIGIPLYLLYYFIPATLPYISLIGFGAMFIYYTYSANSFFRLGIFQSMIKSLLSVILGYIFMLITFFILAFIGILIAGAFGFIS